MTLWDPAAMLEQAEMAANKSEFTQAVHLYSELLSQTSTESSEEAIRKIRLAALQERGRLFTLLGQPQSALASYEQYYAEAGNSRHAVDALVAIGNQCTYMNLTDRALEAHRDALRLAETLHYTAGRAMALGGMGLVYSFLDRSEDALTHLRKSLVLFEQLDNKVEQARCWNRVGVAHVHLGEIDKAITAFLNSSRLAQLAGQMEPIAMETAIISLNNLGECYQSLFDMEQAIIHHRRALVMAKEIELPYLEADLARNLGVDLSYLGQEVEGTKYLNRSLELSVDTNQPDLEVQALYSLAFVAYQQGNAIEAEEHAKKLMQLAEEAGNQGLQAGALHVLGLCREQTGDVAGAQGLWQQALYLAHETGRRMLLWRLHAALSQIASSPDLSSVHNRIAAEIIHQIARPIDDEVLRNKFLTASPVREVIDKATSGDWGKVSR